MNELTVSKTSAAGTILSSARASSVVLAPRDQSRNMQSKTHKRNMNQKDRHGKPRNHPSPLPYLIPTCDAMATYAATLHANAVARQIPTNLAVSRSAHPNSASICSPVVATQCPSATSCAEHVNLSPIDSLMIWTLTAVFEQVTHAMAASQLGTLRETTPETWEANELSVETMLKSVKGVQIRVVHLRDCEAVRAHPGRKDERKALSHREEAKDCGEKLEKDAHRGLHPNRHVHLNSQRNLPTAAPLTIALYPSAPKTCGPTSTIEYMRINVAGLYRAELLASWKYKLRSVGYTAMALRHPTNDSATLDWIVMPMRSCAPCGPWVRCWKKKMNRAPTKGACIHRFRNTMGWRQMLIQCRLSTTGRAMRIGVVLAPEWMSSVDVGAGVLVVPSSPVSLASYERHEATMPSTRAALVSCVAGRGSTLTMSSR